MTKQGKWYEPKATPDELPLPTLADELPMAEEKPAVSTEAPGFDSPTLADRVASLEAAYVELHTVVASLHATVESMRVAAESAPAFVARPDALPKSRYRTCIGKE